MAAGRIHAPLLLNVNLRGATPLGVRVAPMSLMSGVQSYDRGVSPRGQAYAWDESSLPQGDTVEGTDLYWYSRGYITITPLRIDQTDTAELPEMEALFVRP
jgi:5'-nucleotidase